MRIVITDTSNVWRYDDPMFEPFKEILTVVCLNGKAVTDKYHCIVSPYDTSEEKEETYGFTSKKYKALLSAARKRDSELRRLGNVLFLTDDNPESLYPFNVIKRENNDDNLHLCALSPAWIENDKKIKAYRELIADLSGVTSVLYIDSDQYINIVFDEKIINEKKKKLQSYYVSLFPLVLNKTNHIGKNQKSFFDFSTLAYIPIKDGFNIVKNTKKNSLDVTAEISFSHWYDRMTMGFAPPRWVVHDEEKEEIIEDLPARPDGKKICNYLRKLRIALAKANNISFESAECPSVGPCAGTCTKCDEEAEYLRKQLEKIDSDKRIIPSYILTKWEDNL